MRRITDPVVLHEATRSAVFSLVEPCLLSEAPF